MSTLAASRPEVSEAVRERFRPIAYARDVLSVLSWRLLGLVASSLGITALEGLGLAMLAPLLHLVGVDTGQGPVGRLADAVAWAFARVGLPLTLPSVLGAFLLLITAQAFLARAQAMYGYRLQQTFVARLRARLYRALLRSDWRFFLRRRSSDFMHKLTRELEDVGGATFGLVDWIVGVLLTCTYLIFALYLSVPMTLLVLVTGGILSLALRPYALRARDRGGTLSDAYAALFAGITEHLQGMKTAKGHGFEGRHVDAFLAMSGGVERAQVRVLENQQASRFWFRVGSMAILVTMIYLAVQVLALQAATIAVLLYVFSRLVPRLSAIQGGFHAFMGYIPAYVRVRRLEDDCRAAAEAAGDVPAPALRRRLAFEHVTFAFDPPPADPVLRDVSLELPAGTTTAVVGASGAGKSTLADLAVGLLRPSAGAIVVDDTPLTREELPAWRGRIGYVAQDTFLFHDTVRANLTVTSPGADEAAVDRALELAAAGFLRQLPEGLDTVLGDRGVRLSGGERQRLALARALLRRPDLLVLDEATSALDAQHERAVQEALEGLRGRVTVLLIAHRLATVRNADRICVLDDGRIVEEGTWEVLMDRPEGRLRRLAALQGLATGPATLR